MTKTTEILMNNRRMAVLYDCMLYEVCRAYHLTLMEANIIIFLHNNPEKDTVTDIAELRGLSKATVSKTVEELIQKSLLHRRADAVDRRKVHLFLAEAAAPVAEQIELMQKKFRNEIFAGFSQEELEKFDEFNRRIRENTRKTLERSETE